MHAGVLNFLLRALVHPWNLCFQRTGKTRHTEIALSTPVPASASTLMSVLLTVAVHLNPFLTCALILYHNQVVQRSIATNVCVPVYFVFA
jgi:hypothetical protein